MTEYGDAFNAAIAAELRAQRGRARVTFDQLANSTGLAKTTVLNYLDIFSIYPDDVLLALMASADSSAAIGMLCTSGMRCP